MSGTYDLRLVALSYLVAVFASYTALDLAGRVTSSRGRARMLWLVGGAISLGIGIWSMHFKRGQQLTATLLAGVEQYHASVVIIDITGVPMIDTAVAGTLLQ